MGQERDDLRPVCGTIHHGFIAQINCRCLAADSPRNPLIFLHLPTTAQRPSPSDNDQSVTLSKSSLGCFSASCHDHQVQEAALIQGTRAWPSHFPEPSDKCYTEAGAAGSASSNIAGWAGNTDPAAHMLRWPDASTPLKWVGKTWAPSVRRGSRQ